MDKTKKPTPATARMKHLRTLFVDKYLESTVKHLCTTDVPETFGELKGQLDGPSFNILMTLVKEKMQALGPFAQNEFDELCAELELDDRFRQVEAEAAATVAAAQAATNAMEKKKTAAAAAVAAAASKKGAKAAALQAGGEERLSSMTPEDLARHRRMVIKRKELAELQGMQEREAAMYLEAEENLKVTKNKMKAVYHDMSSLAPEAKKLLQRCTEN